jgi:hypothetical protein
LTGDSTATTLSDGSGNYQFSAIAAGGNYTVTPSIAAREPGSPGINTIDVIATQQHFLNVSLLPPGCRRDAADVNGDTLITTVDVIAIQRFFLGLSTGIANTGEYKFTPASRTYPGTMTDQAGQDFDTLIFGDVAAGFVHRPEGPSPTKADDEGTSAGENPVPVATLALPNASVDASRTNFIAPVTASTISAGDNLVGFQGDFTFDERMVIFRDPPVQNAGLTANNWNVSGNVLPGPGPIKTLRVSGFSLDLTPLAGSGTLFELRMSRVSRTAQSTQLIWAAPPDHFIFIDADLKIQTPGNAVSGSVVPSGKR